MSPITIQVTIDGRTAERLEALAQLTDTGRSETAAELLRIVLSKIAKEAKSPNAVGV